MNVLITGTHTGLGNGLARFYLKDEQNTVYGISRNNDRELVYPNFHFHARDLSKLDEIKTKIPRFLKGVRELDLVILNAGVLNEVKDLADTPVEEIRNTMDINVWANKVLIDTLYSIPIKIRQIIAISSGASVSGSRGWNAYALSKATLNMLIRLYAGEQKGTHFCALAPGLIDTAMQDYVYNLPETDKYPVVKKLKAARGTDQMPDPDKAAAIVAKAIEKAGKLESGSFADVRKLE